MTKRTDSTQPPLGVTLADVTPAQLTRLRALERYDLSFVVDCLPRQKSSRSSSVHSTVLDFKRFMGLAALGYGGLPVPSQQVDDVWHAFLRFPREYAAFCQKAVGFLVHHIPTASGPKHSESSRVVRAYKRVFGVDIPRARTACVTCRASSTAVEQTLPA
jgi:hypothetical protein